MLTYVQRDGVATVLQREVSSNGMTCSTDHPVTHDSYRDTLEV